MSTKSPGAQRFFDQGLTLVFAFNHEEAARAFRRATELDPQSAMAFWGIALALGPCINLIDVDPPHERAAYEAVQKALLLSPRGTERERDYIQALGKRYSSDPKVDLRKLDAEYAIAMRELSKHYPDDLDAATLYAESLMDLHPWKLWRLDGRPTEGTGEILAVLESVLRRDANHIGDREKSWIAKRYLSLPSEFVIDTSAASPTWFAGALATDYGPERPTSADFFELKDAVRYATWRPEHHSGLAELLK